MAADLAGIDFPDTPFALEPSLICLARRGSEAQGLYVAPEGPEAGIDDHDLQGICIPPAEYYLGLSSWRGASDIKGPWDVVLTEVRRFVELLLAQNPNVLSILWLDPSDYLVRTEAFDWMREERALFMDRERAYRAFRGYAYRQLALMWDSTTLATRSTYEHAFMGPRRRERVERHGYDTKNACHAIRVAHMGTEYLRDGVLRVRRDWDRQFLLDIKAGSWKIADVQEYAKERFNGLDEAYRHSVLPAEANVTVLNERLTASLRARFR